jgi:hypothetical protein
MKKICIESQRIHVPMMNSFVSMLICFGILYVTLYVSYFDHLSFVSLLFGIGTWAYKIIRVKNRYKKNLGVDAPIYSGLAAFARML